MTERPNLVFDIGGTYTRAAVFRPGSASPEKTGAVLTPNYLSRPSLNGAQLIGEVFDQARHLGDTLCAGSEPDNVIVAYPGPIGLDGWAERSPTILGRRRDSRHDVALHTRRRWPTSETRVINDLVASGYSYVARGHVDFCIVTIGSGIGNKVFVGGHPVLGPTGLGGEIGHLAVPWSPLAGPDLQELGEIASARALIRSHTAGNSSSASYDTELATSEMAFLEEARTGSGPAHELVEQCASALAHVMACIHLAIGCPRFFVTGGLPCRLGDRFRISLVAGIRSLVWDVGQDFEAMVEIEDVGELAALTGAAYYLEHVTGRGRVR